MIPGTSLHGTAMVRRICETPIALMPLPLLIDITLSERRSRHKIFICPVIRIFSNDLDSGLFWHQMSTKRYCRYNEGEASWLDT